MVDPISLTLAGMQNDMAQMGVVANNSANALTPGFKRAFMAVAGAAGNGTAIDSAPLLKTLTDDRPGTPRQTGNPLDIAVLGKGFLEVMTETGPAYTRLGALHLAADGRLVTQDGLPVVGTSGEIVLTTPTPSIDREGRISEQGRQVAQIKIMDFENSNALTPIGGGLLIANEVASGKVLDRPRLAQGQLENSNVDSTREMVKLMETFRHFESSSRVLQAYDELRDKTFRSLGQF